MVCKIECTKLSDEGVADWCLLDATQESLREHMKLLKKAYIENKHQAEEINELKSLLKIANRLTKGLLLNNKIKAIW